MELNKDRQIQDQKKRELSNVYEKRTVFRHVLTYGV